MELHDTISDSEKSQIWILKEKLADYHYHSETLGDIRVGPGSLPLLTYRFREQCPQHTLIKLFLLGIDVEPEAVLEVFETTEIDALMQLGILQQAQNQTISAQAKIYPYQNLNLFCDFPRSGNPPDAVYNPGFDSIKLAEAGLRMPFDTALDLCTGTGIQAILAAQHCNRVMAVDINPRAAHFTKLNLVLNEIDNIDICLGNLYTPVESRTFDLITANPPFVTSPTRSAQYRDGGKWGDELLLQILEQLPLHLNAGGLCQIVTHLYEFEERSQVDYIRKFAEDNQFEALLLLSPGFDKYDLTVDQFSKFLPDYERYQQKTIEYLEHLDALKFTTGFLGVITLRKSSHHRFKALTALSRPIHFDINLQHKIQEFYNLAS